MLIKNLIRQMLNNKYEKEQKVYCVAVCILIWIAIIYVIIISSPISHSNERNERISLDLNNVEKFRLEKDAELSRQRNDNCSYWDCFNIYRCGERLSIYVYPLNDYYDAERADAKSSLSILSREFFEILKVLIESPYYTSDPKDACILVPSIDTLNLNRIDPSMVAKALASLPYWENGENHLLFNVVPTENGIESLNTDRAIVAGANFDSWTYRTGFDVALPFLGYFRDEEMISSSKNRNSFWLTVSILELNELQLNTITDIASKTDHKILMLNKCPKDMVKRSSIGIRCAHGTQKTYDIKTSYAQSQFCLISKTERLFQLNLIEALAANCIPVIFADNIILPFTEIIDWSLAVVTLREADLQSIEVKLKSISLEKLDELQRQGEWLYEQYFVSTEKIIKTVIAELNDRIFAYRAKSYFDWNMPAQRTVQNPLFLSRVAQKSQGFTAVVLTYNRIESLFKLIQKLSVVMSLQKILVVWNNEKEAPPHSKSIDFCGAISVSIFPRISKPLKVIRTKANKLSNRFYPYEEIETEAILTIDDDIIMLTADELDFGYEVWREFPDRIVGFPSRTHIWDNQTLRWRYESEWTNQISMVLTGAAFHHKYWSYAYTNQMPAEIKEWVDDHMNCEDIAMNFLVANFTKKPPIKVAPRKKFKCPECTNTEMLSADISHMMERSACIDRFAKVYGIMPLKTVEFRADPVLYKDNFPEKLKRFNDVGSL